MVEGDGLENRYTPRGYRGFESLALRHFYFKQKNHGIKQRVNLQARLAICSFFFMPGTLMRKNPQKRVIFLRVALRCSPLTAPLLRLAAGCALASNPRSLSRRSFNEGGSAIFFCKKNGERSRKASLNCAKHNFTQKAQPFLPCHGVIK